MHLFLYTALIVFYFANVFFPMDLLQYTTGILALLCISISFKGATTLFKWAGSIFFMVGLALFLYLGKPIVELPFSMISTVTLMAIFFVLPFINSVIVIGRYDQSVSKLLKARVDDLGKLYYRGSLVSLLLGTFLSIATIPLVASILEKNVKQLPSEFKKFFISRVMLRGYALSLVISPMELLVAVSVDITHISYLAFFPWLLLFTMILLLIDWILAWKYRSMAISLDRGNTEVTTNGKILKRTGMLLVYLLLFIAVIVFTNQVFQFGFLTTVSIVILPYSLLWALTIGRFRSYWDYCIPVWKKRTLGLQSYMFLFLSVGLFTTTLNDSGFFQLIQGPVESLVAYPIFLFFIIQIVFLGLAMVGFHPLVTLSILGGILTPLLTLLDPIAVTMVLTTSSLSTIMAGPFNISVSLTGSVLQVNPYQVSWWNLGYAFLFSSIGSIFALLML